MNRNTERPGRLGPERPGGTLAVDPVELLEQLPHVAWAHPDSLVPNAHLHGFAVVVDGDEDLARGSI